MAIESHSDEAVRRTRDFFVPGWLEIFLYILCGFILIIVINVGTVISKLSHDYIRPPRLLPPSFSTLYKGFSRSFSSALGGRLGQVLLWAFVGAAAYIVLWLARSLVSSFENDVIAYHYLHPSYYRRSRYLGSSIFVKFFLVALVLILAGFVFSAVRSILPALAALAGSAAYSFRIETGPLYMLFAVLAAAFVIYITVMLLKLISHLWKLL